MNISSRDSIKLHDYLSHKYCLVSSKQLVLKFSYFKWIVKKIIVIGSYS